MPLFNLTRRQMAKVFASLLVAAAPGVAAAQQSAAHDTLRIGMSQFPSTLHPFFDAMVAKSYVLGMSQRPVTAHDAAWKPTCLLCTELPSLENGLAKKEGKGIAATYTIRDDATWGDGTPVTAKDIIFAWEVGKHPASGVGNAEFYAKDIGNITAEGDKTFTIHFTKQQCDFASIGDFYPLPAHLERAIFEKGPATYMNRSLYATAPATPGLYWGPYMVKKSDAGAAITLEKNPHWKGAAPSFTTVTVKTVENSAALGANLLSGGIDMIAGELGLPLDQALAFEKRLPKGLSITYKPSLTYEHIDLNLDQSSFKDVRVRQALLYGINRDTINKTLFGGQQPVAATSVNPLDTVYSTNVRLYPYDPAKAETLLNEAGFPRKEDGTRGLRLSFATTAGNKSRETIQQSIQSDWKKLGIDVVIDNQPPRVLFGETMRKRNFSGAMFAWMGAPRSVPKTTLRSSMIPSAANSWAGQNYSGYSNPKMDKIIDDLEVVCTPKENQKLWDDLQTLYAEELPALPLYYRVDAHITPRWLTGLTPTGHLHPTTLWIENWGVKE